jgi:hypothetical protein
VRRLAGTPTLILNGKYRINVTRDRSLPERSPH